jgi:hypothetical protein
VLRQVRTKPFRNRLGRFNTQPRGPEPLSREVGGMMGMQLLLHYRGPLGPNLGDAIEMFTVGTTIRRRSIPHFPQDPFYIPGGRVSL